VVEAILEEDPRYRREAYAFIQLALDYYREVTGRGRERVHITGPELLQGVRGLAFREYGPLARTVLNHWGLMGGKDVGEVVYNLIRHHLMSRSPEDDQADFEGVMEFDASMDREYEG